MKRCVLHWLALALVAVTPAMAQQNAGPSCLDDPARPEFAKAATQLEKDPRFLEQRFALARGLIRARCYQEAVIFLEQGVVLHPENRSLRRQLRSAVSLLELQQQEIAVTGTPAEVREDSDLNRCRLDNDIDACDRVLAKRPGEMAALLAKGAALQAQDRPADAIPVYQRAVLGAPTDAAINAALDKVRAERKQYLEKCRSTDGEAGLRACERALLRGASDEFSVYERQGVLLQQLGRPAAALEAYLRANSIFRGGESVARAILQLTDSTGRRDPAAMANRGAAWLTLGQPAPAVVSLQQALAVDENLDQAAEWLAQARERRKRDAAGCLALTVGERARDVCRGAIMQGEEDEYVLRTHLVRILIENNELDSAESELRKAAALNPSGNTVEQLRAIIDNKKNPSPAVRATARPREVPAAEPAKEPGSAVATIIVRGDPAKTDSDTDKPFSNAPLGPSRTH